MSKRKTAGSRPAHRQIIGIVGGLGPWAHIELERNLLQAAGDILAASKDQDFPEWILSSIPQTPDRTLAIEGGGPDPTGWLVQSLKRLEMHRCRDGQTVRGADFAIVACVSAHKFLPSVAAQVSIPVLDMVAETARSIAAAHPGATVGLLATTGTLTAGFFHAECRKAHLAPVSLLEVPSGPQLQQKLVMETIYGPMVAGKATGGGVKHLGVQPRHIDAFKQAAAHLVGSAGADVIVAGCTEIGLALSGEKVCGVDLVNPMRVIAEIAVKRAFGLENHGD